MARPTVLGALDYSVGLCHHWTQSLCSLALKWIYDSGNLTTLSYQFLFLKAMREISLQSRAGFLGVHLENLHRALCSGGPCVSFNVVLFSSSNSEWHCLWVCARESEWWDNGARACAEGTEENVSSCPSWVPILMGFLCPVEIEFGWAREVRTSW